MGGEELGRGLLIKSLRKRRKGDRFDFELMAIEMGDNVRVYIVYSLMD